MLGKCRQTHTHRSPVLAGPPPNPNPPQTNETFRSSDKCLQSGVGFTHLSAAAQMLLTRINGALIFVED